MENLVRVLHVEDDPSIRMVTRVTLEKVGKLQVLSCDGAEEALAKAADFAPQVLLLDVMMPDMDGPSTLAALREIINLDRTLILFMTAKVQQQELDYYKTIGAWGVIFKPFDPMTLPQEVQNHWQNYQASLSQ